MENVLDQNMITFGKYKDLTLDDMLKDRKYCSWLVQQEWFAGSYPFLYNRVMEHCPRKYFVKLPRFDVDGNVGVSVEDFFRLYEYFNLVGVDDLEVKLKDDEKICYAFYLDMIELLKSRVLARVGGDSPFDIKAPNGWLKKFEKSSGLSRDVFKEFLSAYELPNVPYILEDVKKVGGLEYKGAKSFLIAKRRSEEQEIFWEAMLKEKYGEDIGSQFKFKNCIFDMINIATRTLYECKLGLKDFSEEQYKKYLNVLGTQYTVLYLIGCDCVVSIGNKSIYTTNPDLYAVYIAKIPGLKNPGKFDRLIEEFSIIGVENISEYI